MAAGGDGTIHEVVNGIAGSEAALGLLPIGTMNVFANELGLPANDLDRCWEIIRAEHTRLIDLPTANGKYFVQLAGVGLDAQVVKETSLTFKRNFGPLSYLISAAQIAARRPPRLLIESDDAKTEEGSFVLVGQWTPLRRTVSIFQARRDRRRAARRPRLQATRLPRAASSICRTSSSAPEITTREVEYFQTQRLRVSSVEDVPVELDGELVGTCPVEFRMEPRRLKVLRQRDSESPDR